MNCRNPILLLVAAILAAGVIVYLCLPKEPRYQGRTLSQWIDDGRTAYYDTVKARNLDLAWGTKMPGPPPPGILLADDPKWLAGTNAVQRIGTNAIPWLLKWASAEDSKLKAALILWLQGHPFIHIHFRSASEQNNTAVFGLQMLGEEANPAWPLFVRRTFDKVPSQRETALRFLMDAHAGKETLLPVFLRLTQDSDEKLRRTAWSLFLIYDLADAKQELSRIKAVQEARNQSAPTK